jgi:cytochrome c oxidase cbb3-type subunit 3
MKKQVAAAALTVALTIAAVGHAAGQVVGQPPAPESSGGRGAGRGGAAPGNGRPAAAVNARPAAYPDRPPADPAALERGKAIYGVQCNFCHGSDARGGEGGPNLLRSELVLNDQKGELITPVVQNGRGEMPPFKLNPTQIADVAAYIHSFKVGGYDISRMVPLSILVGDATAGQQAFRSMCSQCHSVTGDLKGIASKVTDPKALQNGWLMPGGGGGRGGRGGASPFNVPPTTVSVTTGQGKKVEGRLVRIDDFIVTLVDADGAQKTFRRDGDNPKVEINDPLKAHKDLLPKYTDKQIHDLTSYLVTIK